VEETLPARLCHSVRLEPLQDGRYAIVLEPEEVALLGVRRVDEPLVIEVAKDALSIERVEGDGIPPEDLKKSIDTIRRDYGEALKRLADC
jgi:hypothetical protein